ncbi:hypothetical protein VTL71DRAFT_14545 [Oculimacula yallundae]|uniref:Uncharacterized protein n=1 Tax=Oculimacula yallundae TaxID=86028 RepID=A0ABR4CIS6_9HELO
MSASTSNTKQKKVRYEPGTKGPSSSSHHHRSSRSPSDRDSGVGSSSASDRASLGSGTSPSNTNINSSSISTQRHNLRAVQEALDAANDQIRQVEAEKASLSSMLAESNRENRMLKKEKNDLHNRVEELLDELEDERKRIERMRRGSSEKKSPPRRSSPRNSREIEEAALAAFQRDAARRANSYQQQQQAQMYPAVPQAPANLAPNPFLPSPRNSSSGLPGVAFSPERVALSSSSSYGPPSASPSVVSYSGAPSSSYTHAHAPLPSRSRHGSSGSSVVDGRYHLSPL